MAFQLKPKAVGIHAALAEAEKAKAAEAALVKQQSPKSSAQQAREARGFVEPEQATHRIRIIYDDSYSMHGQKELDAQQGCVEFLRYCTPNQTACAFHPMNKEAVELDTNLPELALLVKHIKATGNTPLFKTLFDAQVMQPEATRYIVFSDGQADDPNLMEACIKQAVERKTPVDTVFIAKDSYYSHAKETMKELAEKTGGYFLIFDRNKVNFGEAFKYLSPGMRHMLAAESFREDLQAGRIK